jgi:branched-chain amino acid transport system ATP-binding protein
MLDIQQLGSGYGRIPILAGLKLELRQGEMLGILGHNGAGKTTLMKTIAGFLPATSGSIRLSGRDVTQAAPHLRAQAGLGYVPQGRRIFPALSVRENLELAAARSGRRVDDVLVLFPRVKRLLDRRGGELSGGEQQLLALARCLCTAPKVVLLDEPTEGIQPSIIEEIIETLQAVNKSDGVAILLVEQNLECLTALASRILVLSRGSFIRELRGDEAHDETALAELMI